MVPFLEEDPGKTKITFISDLLWENEQPTERSVSFPSWPWSGWHGMTKEQNSNHCAVKGPIVADIDIKIECLDAKLVDWPNGYGPTQIDSTNVS